MRVEEDFARALLDLLSDLVSAAEGMGLELAGIREALEGSAHEEEEE